MVNSYSNEPDTVYQQRQPQMDAAPDNSPLGLLGRGLEVLGRPLSATSTALQFGLQNKNPFEGFMQGITGQSQTRGLADVLAQQGVPEGPSIGPLNLRGAAGFLGDIALDPITALTLPFGGGPSVLGRGIRAVSPGLGRAIEAAPVVRGLAGMGERAAPEASAFARNVIEAAPTTGFENTLTRRVANVAANVPMVGNVVAPILNAIDPRLLQNSPVGRNLIQHSQALSMDESNTIPRLMSPIEALWKPAKVQVDKYNRWLLQDGSYQAPQDLARLVAFGKMTEADVQRLLTPAQYDLYNTAKDAWRQTMDALREAGVDVKAEGLETEKEFIPRLIYRTQTDTAGRTRRAILPEQGVQKSVQYRTMEQGIEADMKNPGTYQPADFLTTMQQKMREASLALRGQELVNALKESGLAQQAGKGVQEELKGIPGSQGFKGLRLDPQDARMIWDYYQRRVPGFLQKIADASGIVRSIQSTADFSPGFIQGMLLMTTRPQEWAKMWLNGFRAFADPAFHAKLLARADNQDILQKIPNLIMSGFEPTEALQQGAAGQRLFQKVPGMGQALEAFGRVFDTMGDTARLEWAKALAPLGEQYGKLDAVGSFVNRATGNLSTAAMGIGPSQRAAEATVLLYSPRMTRAALSIVGDAMKGGMNGYLARDSLAHLAVAGTAIYLKMAHALGLDDAEIESRLDPSKGNFMTLPVAGQNVGLGGTYVAIAKMLARSIDDPSKLIQANGDNPLVSFWRGRTAPALKTAWDVLDGETFVGQPLETPIDYLKYEAVPSLMPFAVESALIEGVLQGAGPGGIAANFGAQFAGGRAAPMGYADTRMAVAQRLFGKPFDQLTPEQQVQVGNEPELKNMPPPSGRKYEHARQATQIAGTYSQKLEMAAQAVQSGELTRQQFRVLEGDLARERNAQFEVIGPGEAPKQQTAQETVRRQYLAILGQKDIQGKPDYEKAEEFYAGLDPATQKYIEDKQRASYGKLPPAAAQLMTELWDVRRLLKPYWDIRDQVLEKRNLADKLDAMSPAQQVAFADNPAYKQAESLWTGLRKQYRWKHPDADAALAAWYGLTPIREQGQANTALTGGFSRGFSGGFGKGFT